MICCDSWGRCTRSRGCAAGHVPKAVAPVKAHYRRHNDLDEYCSRPAPLEVTTLDGTYLFTERATDTPAGTDDDNTQDLQDRLRAMVNAANAPGQRGSVWFAGQEPEPTTPPATQPKPRLSMFNRVLLALLALIAAASALGVVAGFAWLVSLEQLT